MSGLKAIIILITAIIVIGAFVDALRDKPPAPAEKPDPVATAEYGCELWTRSHSKLQVSEVLSRYQLNGKTKKGHYKVGLDYRAGASGLLMHSACEYQEIGTGKQLLVSASSSL